MFDTALLNVLGSRTLLQYSPDRGKASKGQRVQFFSHLLRSAHE